MEVLGSDVQHLYKLYCTWFFPNTQERKIAVGVGHLCTDLKLVNVMAVKLCVALFYTFCS